MTDNYGLLIRKLDEFIRKYYKNQLIRGGLYFIATLLAFYIVVTVAEYFGHFGPVVRTTAFYAFVLVNAVILWRLVILPLFKLFRIGKLISHEEAARIIGNHFGDVKDRLLNTLQLNKLREDKTQNTELIRAGIDQKIAQLRPVPFKKAIDLSKNRKYLRYAVPPLLVILVLLAASPSVITEPTTRLVHHQTFFERKAPFSIVILNPALRAVQQEDFELRVKLAGDEVPDNLFIEFEGSQYKMDKENPVLFRHDFKNLQKDIHFQFIADKYTSREYVLSVLPKPIVLNFSTEVTYPAYIHKPQESFQNTGDLIVPEGSRITWRFLTRDTRKISIHAKDRSIDLQSPSANQFQWSGQFFGTMNYSVVAANEFLRNSDSLAYTVSVIPDMYPSIMVEEFKDSVFDKRFYFRGTIRDDYGFHRLTFNYRLLNEKDSTAGKFRPMQDTLPVNPGLNQLQFFHYFDLSKISISPGDEVEYYFEVWDNDGVHGPKSTRSQKMLFKAPSLKELQEASEQADQQMKDQIKQAAREARDLQKKVEDLNRKLIDKSSLSWQDKKQVQDLLDKQKDLQQKIENIRQQNEENAVKEQEYSPLDEEIARKQEELQKLFDEIMTDEMKQQFQELQKMLDNLDKSKVKDMLDKMKLSGEDIEKQLDRNLEIFKQLEFEKKMNDAIDKLNKMAQEQDKLSDETSKNEKNDEAVNKDLQDKQEKLNEDFKDFQKELDDLEKKNKELEEPGNFPETQDQEKQINDEMKNSSDALKGGKNKKASKSQKSAAEKMQKMSEQLAQMGEEMEQEGDEQDMESLREILENVIQVSFDQEALMKQLEITKVQDPKYLIIIKNQKKIKDDLQMVEDSLFALSKRQAMLQSAINKEINAVNQNVDNAMDYLGNRQTQQAAGKQQSAMTGINNLALMLEETKKQMEQQMKQSSSGKGKPSSSCNKPGTGKPDIRSMRELQEALNKKLEQIKNGMMPNQGKPSDKGKQSMSEELARLAAQQEALRKQMQEYGEQLKKEGTKDNQAINKTLKDMEQTETDIVNKMITNQTLKRQQEILTRLLESEKADRQRELDEKRESREAKNDKFSNPNSFFEYKRIKSREDELLKTVPPTLKPFYKNKVNAYFYNFED